MSRAKHSPTPWEVPAKSTDEPGYGVVMDANGQDVAITEMGNEAETVFANAQLIVRAVNSFEGCPEPNNELLSELKKMARDGLDGRDPINTFAHMLSLLESAGAQ